jgi:RimJ/RimL family protein N-acetyltransferase
VADLPEAILLTLPGELDVFLRQPTLADAQAIFDFDRSVQGEAVLQGNDPDEEPMPVAERKEWIRNALESGDCLVLLAEHKSRVKSLLECRVRERPRMNSHVLRFYISIARELWGKGLGTAMLESMLDWARSHPSIEKVSLSVLSSNKRAIQLYRKLGFEEEGRKRREFRLPDGTEADDVFMAIFLERKRK